MAKHPLSLEQAQELSHQYQYLLGSQAKHYGVSFTIECVVISPFDDLNKYMFLSWFEGCEHADKVISFYGGEVFDVVLVGRIADTNRFIMKDLSLHLSENNETLDMLPEV